jgi:hypothetical protein
MRLQITVDGHPALTARMAVARYTQMHGLTERAVRHAVTRAGVPPITPAPIDPKIPLYDQAALDRAMASRPGQGRRRA